MYLFPSNLRKKERNIHTSRRTKQARRWMLSMSWKATTKSITSKTVPEFIPFGRISVWKPPSPSQPLFCWPWSSVWCLQFSSGSQILKNNSDWTLPSRSKRCAALPRTRIHASPPYLLLSTSHRQRQNQTQKWSWTSLCKSTSITSQTSLLRLKVFTVITLRLLYATAWISCGTRRVDSTTPCLSWTPRWLTGRSTTSRRGSARPWRTKKLAWTDWRRWDQRWLMKSRPWWKSQRSYSVTAWLLLLTSEHFFRNLASICIDWNWTLKKKSPNFRNIRLSVGINQDHVNHLCILINSFHLFVFILFGPSLLSINICRPKVIQINNEFWSSKFNIQLHITCYLIIMDHNIINKKAQFKNTRSKSKMNILYNVYHY